MIKAANRFIGGILLVAGTTIGAGMLALPVLTSFAGFVPSLVVFILIWLFMLATAFFFLDVNLAVRGEPNLISMAGRTLGVFGKGIAWVFYLLLLYSLTAAYIAGSTPLFTQGFQALSGIELPGWLAPFSLPLLFGGFVYLGTKGVDYVNRFLMAGLILFYFVLVGLTPHHVQFPNLAHSDSPAVLIAIPAILTSFGYHIIIPSLTTYMEHDAKKLRLVILIGSSIPFIVYFLWQFIVLGSVPLHDLAIDYKAGNSAAQSLARIVSSPWVSVSASLFSFFAIVTSFLGVSLSLSDFLTDGFKIKKTWEGRLLACFLTFVPPLFFVFTYQKGFYLALNYAGAFVAILLGILPALMAWNLKEVRFYRTFKGKLLLLLVVVLSVSIVIIDIMGVQDYFKDLIQKYFNSVE